MSKLTILMKSQDVITQFLFHFAYGGHFLNIMQIMIFYGLKSFWVT